MTLRLTASAVRQLHLHAQGLDRRARRSARREDVLDVIRRMGVLQIDTISVVARSPYFVLFSRLGAYEPAWLEDLLAAGALFEYWAHEASFLPIEDYALVRHRMLHPESMGWKYRAEWVAKHRHELDRVLEYIRANGAVRSADFERRADAASGWWEWKPEKRALEALFTAGDVMVARRQSFQRVYDLRERVHTAWSDDMLPAAREIERQVILRSVGALGIATARWVADYYRMPKRTTPDRVRELAAEGELVEVVVDGWREPAYVLPRDVETARAAADSALKSTVTTLLSPFDPVVWDRTRATAMFGFDYRIECYTPAPKRQYGYYVLPVLRRGGLVARLDAKAHRREGMFEVKAFHLEESARMSDALLRDVARAIVDAAAWHGTPDVVVRRTAPRALRAALVDHIRGIA